MGQLGRTNQSNIPLIKYSDLSDLQKMDIMVNHFVKQPSYKLMLGSLIYGWEKLNKIQEGHLTDLLIDSQIFHVEYAGSPYPLFQIKQFERSEIIKAGSYSKYFKISNIKNQENENIEIVKNKLIIAQLELTERQNKDLKNKIKYSILGAIAVYVLDNAKAIGSFAKDLFHRYIHQ